jgi:hypothetical protein
MSNTGFAPGTLYRHFKGMRYRILGLGRHSETCEELVFYEALYDNPMGKLWARPKTMFLENVVLPNGNEVPRFQKIDE